MTHETARQRKARHKRDPYRAAQIAPVVTVPTVRCVCGHVKLIHVRRGGVRDGDCVAYGGCVAYGCDCTEWTEQGKRVRDGG